MRSRFSNDTHGAGDAVLQCCSVARGDSTHFFSALPAQHGRVRCTTKLKLTGFRPIHTDVRQTAKVLSQAAPVGLGDGGEIAEVSEPRSIDRQIALAADWRGHLHRCTAFGAVQRCPRISISDP